MKRFFFLLKSFIFINFLLSGITLRASPIIGIIGDSVTEGYGVSSKSVYTVFLKQSLQKDFPHIEFVINAISGSVTASAPARIQNMMGQEKKLSGIMIGLAGNDLLRGTTPAVTEKNFFKIVELAQKNNIPVLIGEIPFSTNDPQMKDIAAFYKKMYAKLEKEKGVTMLPEFLVSVFKMPNLNQKDGIHPNEKGHEIMAQTIYPPINRWIQQITKKVP